MSFKLGKLPARPEAVKLKLTDYLPLATLPPPPKTFGHFRLVVENWGMLGNDNYGDCVWAGAGHETRLWNREAKRNVSFTDQGVLSDYSAVTGFNPNDPNSDQGTDMQVAASYRRKTGVLAQNARHKVMAYLALKVGDVAQLKQAIYLFSAVGLGIQFPDYAMKQFDSGETWHVAPGGKIVGGHYIPAVGYDGRYIYVVTWGKIIKMSWGFFRKYNDESLAYLSAEMLTNNQSLEGFNLPQLQSDLSNLGTL